MANDDVVPNNLTRIGEASLVLLTVVNVAGPTVGLDTDGNVNLGHFKSACDIADLVVVGVACMGTSDSCRTRGNLRNTSVETTIVRRIVSVGIVQRNATKRVTVEQAFDLHLIKQRGGHLQILAVVRPGEAVGGNGGLLLIEERELQAAVIGNGLSDLVVSSSRGATIRSAFDSLVQLPAVDRRARERESLANLQSLGLGIRNLIAIHVNVVDGNLGVLVAGVIERKHVLTLSGGQDERLLDLIGMELDAIKLGMISAQRLIVNSRGILNDGSSVARNVIDTLLFRNRSASTSLPVGDDVAHDIASLIGLRLVHDVDDVFAVITGERQGRARALRTIAGDGHGILGNNVANLEIRISNSLTCGDRSTVLVNIVDRVSQRLLSPVSIDGSIRGDLVVPVVEFVSVSCGVPAIEGISFLGRRPRILCLLVLLDSLAIVSRPTVGIEAHRIRRRIPFGIENQVGCRHSGEGVRRSQARVGIPAGKGVVAVDTTLCSCRRPGIRRLVDVGVKLDILDSIELRAAVEVVNLERVTVVVEVVRGNMPAVARASVLMIIKCADIGIASDVLCSKICPARV